MCSYVIFATKLKHHDVASSSSDIGWKPFVESWAATREDANERQVLPSLFEKYVEATRTIVRKGFKEVTPLRVLNKVPHPAVGLLPETS